MNKKGINENVLQQQSVKFIQRFSRKKDIEEKTMLFTTSQRLLHRFGNRYNLKYTKIIRAAGSTSEEAAALFMIKFKKIIDYGEYKLRQIFNCDEIGLFGRKYLTELHS